jgi:flagellar hook-associated protein 2
MGTESATFAPGKSLNDLAAAINKSGLDVQATIVNIGTDFRLSVTSTKLGSNAITLTQSSNQTNLLGSTTLGTAASYSINGLSQTNGDSLSVSVAPGLTVNMIATGTTTIAVSRDRTAMANALQSFVSSVNTAMGELDTHRGQGIGALNGDPLVGTLQAALRDVVASPGGNSSFHSLVDLGVSFDSTGKLLFDQSTFNLATLGKMTDVLSFLGSSTTGGFLKSATATLNGLEDSTSGIIKTSVSTVTAEMTAQDSLISAQQDSINTLTKNLQAQYAASDAAIAMLQQQANYYTNMFAAMATAAKGM